jgi:hypothetical protein
MEYLLLIYIDGSFDFKSEEAATLGPDVQAWIEDVDRRGIRVQGSALGPMRDAITIRLRQGETEVADGPLEETREYIAGFDILACADRNEAIEVASKHPVARFGRVELRPCLV